MKKGSVQILLAMLCVAALTSCGKVADALGLKGIALDKEEVVTTVKDVVIKNVDAKKWKIYEIRWSEKEELGNNLGNIDLAVIDAENNYYTLPITQNTSNEFIVGEVKESSIPASSRAKILYEEVIGFDMNKLDGAAIIKQIEAAKALIPAEYEFKSVAKFAIKEDVRRIGKSDHLRKVDKKQYGKQSVKFTLNALKKGEGVEMKGRQIITNYYDFNFEENEDGTIVIVD